jgi:hypothetical protein
MELIPRQNGDGEEMMLTMFGRCKNPLPWGREYKNLIPDEKSSVDISTCSSDNQNRWSCVTGKDAKLPGRRRTKHVLIPLIGVERTPMGHGSESDRMWPSQPLKGQSTPGSCSKKFCKIGIIALSFLFDKYCLIID